MQVHGQEGGNESASLSLPVVLMLLLHDSLYQGGRAGGGGDYKKTPMKTE